MLSVDLGAVPGVLIMIALGVATVWSAVSIWHAHRARQRAIRYWEHILSGCEHGSH